MRIKTKVRSERAFKRHRRHLRVRRKVFGTPERPRLCVFRSSRHIYAQLIDDERGHTVGSASSLKIARTSPKEKGESVKKITAREVGKLIAQVAREKGITRVRFDRGGYLYHGRIAALAEAARENGLQF